MIALLAALVLGVPHNAPSPIGPDPHPDATQCVYVIPIATPGAWMCPDGFSPIQRKELIHMKKHLKFAGYVVATLLVVSSITLSKVANVLVEALEEQPS